MSFQVRKLKEPRRRRFISKKALIGLLQIARPLVAYYHDWKYRKQRQEREHERAVMLKRFLLILVAIFAVLLLLGGIAKAFLGVRNVGLKTVMTITGSAPLKDEHGYTNLLLLGQGDANHDGKDLTDTIMVASIDPTDTKSVVLLSIPRDVYFLRTEKMGKGRINSMYRDYKSYLRFQQGMEEEAASAEAIRELGDEIGRKFNLQIHHVIKVDFVGFTKAVDMIGGVTVDVPEDIIDTEYPDGNYGFETFEIRAGRQTLGGETALKYVRSRHTTSDFGRSARQQQVLTAMAEQAKTAGLHKNPGKIADALRIFNEDVETTMTVRELIGLAELATEIDRERVLTMQLNDRNALYDGFIESGGFLYTPPRDLFSGASVLLPVSIPEFPVTWKQPQALSRLLFQTRKVYLEKPQINVLNAGARSGLARRLATELIRYGFEVDQIANADIDDLETSIVSAANENDPLAMFFADVLSMQATPFPLNLPIEQQNRLTIIVGNDYTYTPIQDLF